MHDDYQEYDDEPAARMERTAVWVVVLMLLGLTTAGSLWLTETDSMHDVIGYAGRTGVLRSPNNGRMSTVSVLPKWAANEAVGTAGTVTTEPDQPTIREIDSIVAASDPVQLVGRKVDLRVPVDGRANNVALWVGRGDRRMLVVMERDRRSAAARQMSLTSPNDIAPLQAGEEANIVGTIERLPRREERYSWGLSTRDEADAIDRAIYIRAESVRAESPGT
jgi:hypothetical protein